MNRTLSRAAFFALLLSPTFGSLCRGQTNSPPPSGESVRHGPVIEQGPTATPPPTAPVAPSTPAAPGRSGPVVLPPPDKAPAVPANPQFQIDQSPSQPTPPTTPFPPRQSPPDPSTLATPAGPGANPPGVNPPVAAVPPAASGTGPQAAGPGKDEIYDIRPPIFFLHGWLWLWLLLAALALIALAVLLWRWFATRSVLNPLTAYDLALKKIEQARPLMNTEDPAPYAVAISEAIRTYLTQRFLTPSDRRTTEEFLRQMENDPHTPLAEHRDLLRDFLQSCDLLKFSRYRPSADELEQVQQRALNFVTATKPLPVPSGRPAAQGQLVPRAT